MSKTGLKLIEIKSIPTRFDAVDNIADLLTNDLKADAKVVAYLDYKVLIGTCKNGTICFHNDVPLDLSFVQRMRVFNKDAELFVWRTEDGLRARLREDREGTTVDVVEATQVLFGTRSKPLDGFTKLKEDRGTEIILPGGFILDEKNDKKRVAVKTRNYIDYPSGQATYVDCRFVDFVTLPEN